MYLIDQLERIRTFGHTHHVPIVSWETERFLCTHVDSNRPLRCLEIGSAIGYSTLLIGGLISSRGGRLASYEISLPSYRIARANIAASGLHNIDLYHGDILRFPLSWWQDGYDFVFVDGAKAQYATYLNLVWPHLRPHATLICDDVISYEHKMQDLGAFLSQLPVTYERISLADGDGVLLLCT